MHVFDKQAKMMSHLTTKLLSLNMPTLAAEYGRESQVDLITTIDTEKFMQANKGDHHVFTIDKHGNVKGSLNLVAYMRAAPKDLASRAAKTPGREGVELLVNSDEWPIARTIYASFTAKGKVGITKKGGGVSRLSFGLDDLSISKLDFYRGLVEQLPEIAQKKEDDDDDFEDEDDDDKPDDGKTMEGGLIMALANMQLTQRLSAFLPKYEHDFSANITHSDVFDCYGIRLDIPELKYFQGGFMIQGDYHKRKMDESACGGISTSSADLLSFSSVFGSELQQKVDHLDGLYNSLRDFNPDLAAYFIKPSEIVQIVKDEGLEALGTKLSEKIDAVFGSIGVGRDTEEQGGGFGIGKLINAGLEHVVTELTKKGELQWKVPNKYTDAAFGHKAGDTLHDKLNNPEFKKNREAKIKHDEKWAAHRAEIKKQQEE